MTEPQSCAPYEGCSGLPNTFVISPATASEDTPMRSVCFFVTGMKCEMCAQRIQETLRQLDGVHAVTVDLSSERVDLQTRKTHCDGVMRQAEEMLTAMGYALFTDPPRGNPVDSEGPPPLFHSFASLVPVRSSTSTSSCSSSQLQRHSDASRTAVGAPFRPNSSLASSWRLRRAPCGCGGRGCLCACAPELDMMNEETRLLREDDRDELRPDGGGISKSIESFKVSSTEAMGATRCQSNTQLGSAKEIPACKTTLLIEGMSCTSCAARIEAALQQVSGIERATVNFSMMEGQVIHDPSLAPLETVVRRVADMGYTATTLSTTASPNAEEETSKGKPCTCSTNLCAVPMKGGNVLSAYEHRLHVDGMACVSCAAGIERTVLRLPTVVSCTVLFSSSTALVTTRSACGGEEVCRVIESMGYTVTDITLQESDLSLARTREALARTRIIAEHERNLMASALLSVPLIIAMVVMMFTSAMENRLMRLIIDGVQFCASTPIVFYFGQSFFTSAWRNWQHGAYTMDTLVAIGTGCTYCYSAVAYLLMLFVFPEAHVMTCFDTAGMLMTFMLLGRYLEARAARSTNGALIQLMSMVPPTAIWVKPDGNEVRVSVSNLQRGCMIRVLAGDRVPVDGTIVEGISDLDEQMITGESLPTHKKPNDMVVGGTLNLTASLLIRADKVGEDTMIANVLRIVQEAQNSKPALQRVADRVAMSFVPLVLLFSFLTLTVWLLLGATNRYPASWRGEETSAMVFAFRFFIATVVVACPCAMGLATPTAIMVGTGVGAKNGILVKSGTILEDVRRVNCVVLDKTGTITNGLLEVVRVDTSVAATLPADLDMPTACHLIGLVEAQSSHPVAKAVSAKLLAGVDLWDAPESCTLKKEVQARYEVSSVITHSGKGVKASVMVRSPPCSDPGDSHGAEQREIDLLIGNTALLRENGVPFSSMLSRAIAEENARGLTTVVAAIDKEVCALISLADEPKREARGVIRHLQKAGVCVLMVTGDNCGVARRVASEVGIDLKYVRAEALPMEKADIVKEMEKRGLRVMFVGDGVNDSPALAQSHVGVALGAGTEIAIEAADAVLVRNSLVDLLNLRSLSEVTVRRIYGNFAWAFGYNMLMVPVASGMLYPFVRVQLPPVVAGAAMMLSSLSVLVSSLSIRCFVAHRASDFFDE